MGKDAPSIVYGSQVDYKKLYHSDPDAALKIDITIPGGHGVLKMGHALAVNLSAAGNIGKYVPYNPTTFTGGDAQPGKAFLVSGVSSEAIVYVIMDDSYKFVVGDDLIINSNGVATQNLGAITDIDRDTYSHMAAITVTDDVTGNHTVANSAYVAVEAGDSSNNYADCVGVLEKSVDCGVGEDSKGALATLILSNCLLYTGMLTHMDAAARADLSASQISQFTKIT